MAHLTLERADDWHLENDEQDVRGWPVHDPRGQVVGIVDKMIVDTEREIVDVLVLESGIEIATASVALGDDIVFLKSAEDGPDAVVETYDNTGHLVDREIIYDDSTVGRFREHCVGTYGADYDGYDFAYRYGYDRAHAGAFAGRTYDDADRDLRSGFASDYPDYRYDDYGHAVRYGYEQGAVTT